MNSREDLSYLDERLAGPILRIEDPRDYSEEDILKSYYREIVVMAGPYTRPNISKADLVCVGIEGLLDAIKRWDPVKAKGNPKNFHNLAIIRIKNAMYNHFLENTGRYKFPSYMARGINYLSQVRRAIEDTEYTGDVEDVIRSWEHPEFEKWASTEAAKKVRAKKKKIKDLASSINQDYEATTARILKAERNIEDYEQGVREEVLDPEELSAKKEFLEGVLKSLHPDAREIIEMSLAGMTLEEIGEAQGKTRQRIQQIRSEVVEFLKKTRMYKTAFDD